MSNTKSRLLTACAAAIVMGEAFTTKAAVPQLINYQGRLVSNGTNFTGTGQFKFVLLNGAGTPAYWNNKGSNTGTNEPSAGVPVPVMNGLYSVLLGDTSVSNMTAIPLSVFANTDVRLRVWFSNGTNGYQMLTPDQRISAVGYALMAAGVADGAISSAQLANSAVTSTKLAPGSITGVHLAAGAVSPTNIAADFSDWFRGRTNLPLGTCTNCASLDIQGTDICKPAVTLDGCLSQISAFIQQNGARAVQITAQPFGGEIFLRDKDTNTTLIAGSSSGSGGFLTAYNANERATLFLDGHDANGGGLISVRNTNAALRAEVKGQGFNGGGEFNVFDANGTKTAALWGAGASTGQGAALTLFQGNGQRTVLVDAEDGDNKGAKVLLYNHNGEVAIDLNAEVDGHSKITTDVLRINGADFSENFDIKPIRDGVKPGMIVCIDPENPGRLVTSTKAYDTTVAGIISGAGGVRTGVIAGHRGTLADGEYPVALTGRVYCMVDASKGAVRPGDLITTSDMAGHAMKASDSMRAHGAIIGKAMTGLQQGQGLVLVLVSLQ